MEYKTEEIRSSQKKKEEIIQTIQFKGFERFYQVPPEHGDSFTIQYEYPEFEDFINRGEIFIYESANGGVETKRVFIYQKGKRFIEILVGEFIVLERGNLDKKSKDQVENNFFEKGELLFEEKEK